MGILGRAYSICKGGREIDCSDVDGTLFGVYSEWWRTHSFGGEDPEGLPRMFMLMLINKPAPMSINLSIRADPLRIKKIVHIFPEYQ